MKTNFNKDTKLVLVDKYDQKVMAIITVKAGEQNISSTVAQAIKEDRDAEDVFISPSLEWENGSEDFEFDAEVVENGDNNVFDFELVPTADYYVNL